MRLRVRELHSTYRVREIDDDAITTRQVTAPRVCAALLAAWPVAGGRLDCAPVEHFVVVVLNTRHRIMAAQTVSVGTLDGTMVHPREVYRPAVVMGAAAIIAIHNHPSGDPSPSPDDRAITERLRAAGETIGIPLVDHVIIGHDGQYFSFKEHAQL